MTDLDQKAREIAESTFGQIMLGNPDDPADGVNPMGAINIITAALLSVRNETLEEAASLVEAKAERRKWTYITQTGVEWVLPSNIATAIRSLKQKGE